MKINEAPERLYLSDFTDTTESVFYVKQDNTKKTDIEYVRKDAFVEKAEEFIYAALNDGIIGTANIEDFIRLFKKYMED